MDAVCLRGISSYSRNYLCILIAERAIIRATIGTGYLRIDVCLSVPLFRVALYATNFIIRVEIRDDECRARTCR